MIITCTDSTRNIIPSPAALSRGKMRVLAITALLLGVGCLLLPGTDGRDMATYCGACKAVVDELQYAIKQEDPKKTIQTGSFRMDSHGKQRGVKKKRYAGSEAHLAELLEDVCGLMSNYGVSTDSDTGRKSYIRFNSRPGESLTISGSMSFGAGDSRELETACGTFISEYEDDIVDLFAEGGEGIEEELCYDIAGYCEDGAKHTEL